MMSTAKEKGRKRSEKYLIFEENGRGQKRIEMTTIYNVRLEDEEGDINESGKLRESVLRLKG